MTNAPEAVVMPFSIATGGCGIRSFVLEKTRLRLAISFRSLCHDLGKPTPDFGRFLRVFHFCEGYDLCFNFEVTS